jgi:hypothetical protein
MITIVALVLAMGGASYGAAQRYIITQKNQIKPSVLRQLKGATGPRGATGPAGPPGAQGAQGSQGPAGGAGGGISSARVVLNGAVPALQVNTGFSEVRHNSVGNWCLTPPAGYNQKAFVSLAMNITGIVIQIPPQAPCNAGDIHIVTATTGGTLADYSFNIMVPTG